MPWSLHPASCPSILPPMRWFWLDRYTEFVTGSHATAVKCVSLSEDHLQEHWPSYPIMPNTLIAEGMAQCGGLLVSEIYQFSELVVLAKFAKCSIEGEARPGDTIRYHAKIEHVKDFGASVTVKGDLDGKPFSEGDIFFARYDADSSEHTRGRVLFDPLELLKWLRVVGVFDVGVRPDGTRLRVEDYPHLNERRKAFISRSEH
ncbi:MAG TPA: 3-hydroxyacyl-ACP dehydratase FabZ family protein [Lacipirellulaceae bacterium]|nr:3-hydroxyacyl-ACP dehydratase FabZ family protein [Lacipirellulaceae bacterium]